MQRDSVPTSTVYYSTVVFFQWISHLVPCGFHSRISLQMCYFRRVTCLYCVVWCVPQMVWFSKIAKSSPQLVFWASYLWFWCPKHCHYFTKCFDTLNIGWSIISSFIILVNKITQMHLLHCRGSFLLKYLGRIWDKTNIV